MNNSDAADMLKLSNQADDTVQYMIFHKIADPEINGTAIQAQFLPGPDFWVALRPLTDSTMAGLRDDMLWLAKSKSICLE